jgi:hypothetical protein
MDTYQKIETWCSGGGGRWKWKRDVEEDTVKGNKRGAFTTASDGVMTHLFPLLHHLVSGMMTHPATALSRR